MLCPWSVFICRVIGHRGTQVTLGSAFFCPHGLCAVDLPWSPSYFYNFSSKIRARGLLGGSLEGRTEITHYVLLIHRKVSSDIRLSAEQWNPRWKEPHPTHPCLSASPERIPQGVSKGLDSRL